MFARFGTVLALCTLFACDPGTPSRDEVCTAQDERVRKFIAGHRSCGSDADCAIIGSCSQSFSFAAVSVSAREESQRLPIDRECAPQDGPTYAAMCEQGSCVARTDGAVCGGDVSTCKLGYELYSASCGGEPSCRKRCTGAADTSCGAGFSCQQTQVAPVGECTATLPRWLCMPEPRCELLLGVEADQDAPYASRAKRTILLNREVDVELWAENLTSAPKTLRYQRPCPAGPTLTGLSGYDAWNSCLAGVCETNAPTELMVPAGARVSLGRANIARAANSCNPSGLAMGNYEIGFVLDAVEGATLCGPETYELVAP